MSNNIYYRIWADAILRYKKFHPDRADWKLSLFIQMTWMHTLNWWIIFIWLKFFNILNIPLISIDIFPGTILNNFLSFILEFAFPFGILNYFLIFFKNRYEKIIAKYENLKGDYAGAYSLAIIFTAFISAILYGSLN